LLAISFLHLLEAAKSRRAARRASRGFIRGDYSSARSSKWARISGQVAVARLLSKSRILAMSVLSQFTIDPSSSLASPVNHRAARHRSHLEAAHWQGDGHQRHGQDSKVTGKIRKSSGWTPNSSRESVARKSAANQTSTARAIGRKPSPESGASRRTLSAERDANANFDGALMTRKDSSA